MKKQTGIWKTKEGKEIRVCDMTDSHLLFACRLMERGIKQSYEFQMSNAYATSGMLTGEMAMECAEMAIREMEETDPLEWGEENFKAYKWLLNEIERRNLERLPLEQRETP